MAAKLYAGIEAGGTKFVCAVGDEHGELVEQIVIPTTTPAETIPQVVEFFMPSYQAGKLAAMGVGAFGPIDRNPHSTTYGMITATPKLAWQNYDFLGALQQHFNLPMGFETDVACAALAEYRFDKGCYLQHIFYLTVGTGIGGASIVNGKVLPGMSHQEVGHMLIPHDKESDPFSGVCPYHNNCLEGLACGGAVKKRWQVEHASDLAHDHPAWDLEADYLAAGLMNIVLTLSPGKIILGGGVMKQEHLFPRIRTRLQEKLQGYIQTEAIINDIDNYVVPPALSEAPGVVGAIALAHDVLSA